MKKIYIKTWILVLLIALSIFNYISLNQYTQPLPANAQQEITIQDNEQVVDVKSFNLPENQTEAIEAVTVVLPLLGSFVAE
ncbi:MAG TPA: hypothetical protein VJA47_00535 [archaeon]|nr:hypothetical protein [archaeon]